MMDATEAREHAYAAIEAIKKVLADPGDVETKYLERLLEERDRYIFALHYQLGLPVLEVAARVGIPWHQVFDITDATIAKNRARAGFGPLFKDEPAPSPKAETEIPDLLTEGYAGDSEDGS